MSRYSDYFLNSRSNVVQLELLEIYHPNMSKTYRIVRNSVLGVTVNLENGQSAFFQYVPIKVENNGARDDLEQSLTITFGDLGEILPNEMDNIRSANGFNTKASLIYRTYRSDDLSSPIFGPVYFEIESFSFDWQGATFEAKAPSTNINKTGESYDLDRFPMRGLIQ